MTDQAQEPADENSKLRLAAGKVQTLMEQQWEHTAKTMRPYDQGVMTGLERALTLMSSILDGGGGPVSSTESGDLSKRVCLALDCYASTLHMQANTERLAGFRVGKLQELAWIEALRQEFAQQPAPDPAEAPEAVAELVDQWYDDAQMLDVDQNNPQLSQRINTLRGCADELRVALRHFAQTEAQP